MEHLLPLNRGEYINVVTYIYINECASNPCTNGGQCKDEVNGFSCVCSPGFTGNQCEIDFDECASNPCLGGVCADHVNQYTCICNPGKTGKHCEFDTTCMVSNPCLNGGTCSATHGGGYTCQCNVLFAGINCQLESFNCWRSTVSNNYPTWPVTGKFDKIAFSLSADHYVLGIRVGSTSPERVDVTVTVKITHSDGCVIVTKTISHRFPDWTSDPVFFDQAVLLTAGQQYIAASHVAAPNYNYFSLRKYKEGASSVQCGGITVTFSKVSPAEFADSNGSNVLEGRVPALILRSP
ncbi:neurogenic locus notch homolog protein 1-like [Stylophora pistillata]|uniref:neurogenic locus notch homolog protein 1-like n=1 Tax=Stylophora pistillata TaxID=50429 RepID=UPI000C051515|nr:neurogenic locus notch homolog protein 1-like [Stylophora pistillata]